MRWWLGLLFVPLACQGGNPRTIDSFDSAEGWKVIQSDQVSGTLRNADGGLCLDYDFHGVSGYVGLQREVALDYPDNYAFAFRLRGTGPKNDLQFKLVDASGDNVWWATKPKYTLPADWTPMRFKKRHISKAWGPSEDKELKHSAKLEFTLASGEGGKGGACFDALSFDILPPPDDSPLKGWLWRDKEGRWLYDLKRVREIGGLIVRDGPQEFEVSLSNDGKQWRVVVPMTAVRAREHYVALPEEEARYVRLQSGLQINSQATDVDIEVQPLAFAATPNDFVKEVAKRSPRGAYPRGFIGEQQYWTIVGVDGGKDQGLIGEDGAIEVGKGGFSIEPHISGAGDYDITWANVDSSQSLQDGYLPIPSVHWRHKDLALDITVFAVGPPESARLVARYRLTNNGLKPTRLWMNLSVRPFQVNPPSQFLNTTGGVSPIREIGFASDRVEVNGERRVFFSPAEREVGMHYFNDPGSLRDPIEDPTGLASATLRHHVTLEPGEQFEVAWSASLDGKAPTPITVEEAARLQRQVAAEWHDKLDRVRFTVPQDGQRLIDTIRTALAHMAISRVGPRLQPGTRSYSRAWIRDGAMISEGLLRLGREDIATDFLTWYAPYQFDSGKVPCCVDDRGADPVPENDSHGELIYLVAEVYRYTHDRALLESMWPHVQGAVRYMDELRASERTEENRRKNPAFYGLMPASISHEGYSAKPMHSYWDDFWALRGYKDAVEIAEWLGHANAAKQFAASRDQFRADLYASLKSAMAQEKIDFLPGSAELGDFDATSTTIALAPGGEQASLPQDALLATFERYWTEFEQRRNDQRPWKDYTPYELRTVGTFVRLGWRDRAQSALDFFFADQQPRAWNQWAEVVSHTPRTPFFLGDLPHAWVASDYVRSALDLFAYERNADDALVIAAGIPAAWWMGEGVAVDGLRTPGGALVYSLKADAQSVHVEIGKGLALPKGGLVLSWPFDGAPGATTVNGVPVAWKNAELRIDQVPAVIDIHR